MFTHKKALSMKVKFLGVDDDTVPEKFYKGKKDYLIDGDLYEYEDFVKLKCVPEAYELLVDAHSYFRRWKVIETGDKTKNEANKYKMAVWRKSTKFPTAYFIFTLLITLLFAYFSFLNPDETPLDQTKCANKSTLTLFFKAYFTLHLTFLTSLLLCHCLLLHYKRTGTPSPAFFSALYYLC
jgi:hypothetical protein